MLHIGVYDPRVPYNVIDTAVYPSSMDGDQTGTAIYVDFPQMF